MSYRVIDVRGRYGNADGSWGTGTHDLGVILHYAGLDVAESWWDSPLAYIKHIARLHSQRGRFAPGWTFSGAGAYQEYIFGRTVYRVMNWRAWTPHCGNLLHNKRSLSLHIPIGLNQLPKQVGDGTLVTAMQRADDHLRAMGLGRSGLRGHREVGASNCPGDVIQAAISRYRSGADFSGANAGGDSDEKPPQSPVQSGIVYRVIAGSFSHRSNANDRARQLQAKGFPEPWIYQSGQHYRVQAASYEDEGNADEMVQRLKSKGFESYSLAEKA